MLDEDTLITVQREVILLFEQEMARLSCADQADHFERLERGALAYAFGLVFCRLAVLRDRVRPEILERRCPVEFDHETGAPLAAG